MQGKGSSLQLICNAHTAFLLCGEVFRSCIICDHVGLPKSVQRTICLTKLFWNTSNRGRGVVVATPSLEFRRSPRNLDLVSKNKYSSPLSIYAQMSTIGQSVTWLRRHKTWRT